MSRPEMTAGILAAAPRLATPTDRHQPKNAAPHGRTLSSTADEALVAPRSLPLPVGARPTAASPFSPLARALRASAAGGMNHRRRAPRSVFRRRGGKSVAGFPERRPAGVWSSIDPSRRDGRD